MTTEAGPVAVTSEVIANPGTMTPEAAQAAIRDRIADRDFGKKLLAKDEAASKEWGELHRQAFPTPHNVATAEDINNQAAARAAQQWNGYIGALKQRFPLTDTQESEIRSGVVNAEVFAWAKDQKEQMLKDRAFRVKLLD